MTDSREPDEEGAMVRDGEVSSHDTGVGGDAAATSSAELAPEEPLGTQGMIPGRRRRRTQFERVAMRILATSGIIGLDVALGAILAANKVQGWIVGLVIGVTSVILAAVLWSSRQL
jgi:hypothetical protein